MPDWIPTDTPVEEAAEIRELTAQLEGADATIEHLRESLADVELMLEDRGWQRLGVWGDQQFSRQGLLQAQRLTRTMAIVNPLIRRGLNLRIGYIWGSGVTIQAKATGNDEGEQDVNAVIQAFLDDKANRKVLTGPKAREDNERALGTDGSIAFALPTHPRTGRVQVRDIPIEEITGIVYNPQDRTDPWFYVREWSDADGKQLRTYYPDVNYRPAGGRPTRIRDIELGTVALDRQNTAWDTPVIKLDVNGLKGWDFGVGDAFASIAWARAYKEFLEDWARLMKALSRFAWRVTSGSKTKAQAAAAKARQAATVSATGEPNDVGGLVSMGPDQNLEAIPKTGATIDAESGKPLAGLVAAGMDVPVTMLLTDPGITGARATAETLDEPTYNMANMRRDVWSDFYVQLLDYVIDASVRAPQGELKGIIGRDEWGRQVVTLDGDTTRTIEVAWPDLNEVSIETLMAAIESADATEKLPPLLIVKLLMKALRVPDADEWEAKVTDEDGEFKDPRATAGQAAADAFRRGDDPAAIA